jgi:hypothetical protein
VVVCAASDAGFAQCLAAPITSTSSRLSTPVSYTGGSLREASDATLLVTWRNHRRHPLLPCHIDAKAPSPRSAIASHLGWFQPDPLAGRINDRPAAWMARPLSGLFGLSGPDPREAAGASLDKKRSEAPRATMTAIVEAPGGQG